MDTGFRKRLLVVWLALSAITLAYLWVGSVDPARAARPSAVVTTSAILMAVIKVRIIFREFMEVRHAPAVLCRLTDAWVVLMAVSLLASYFTGMAIWR
ncbi:cytochrome C oxidase subunit IV family protein [Mycobacterium botniense]|uniref:Prokaryotic cytochrome C oxidase subunit IV family protein n=1 Tax=Mycobacterium botniense TaxID=84962 RepID=A0A7I9XXL3_9MYCO|nr:cytochrome C oxidase subunit IV family protein [Mycobacterium botniense]GFG74515.1 prokaryotic cytochrome C oxidase subunit IV family protein [Mycobacterium botniense]